VALLRAPLTVVSVAVYLLGYWSRYALDLHPDVKQVFRFARRHARWRPRRPSRGSGENFAAGH